MPGWLEDITKGGVEGIAKGLGDLAIDIRTAITGKQPIDATKAAEIELAVLTAKAGMEKAQLEYEIKISEAMNRVNEVEAASPSLWNRWRGAAGWTCVLAIFYSLFARPVFPWVTEVVFKAFGSDVVIAALPSIDTTEAFLLLGGMLGLGMQRMFEKKWGAASK